MLSFCLILTLASLAFAQGNSSCSDALSCHAPAPIDTCCTESPGGLVLLTQFWDNLGPKESWTLHGLWPDKCDGSFDTNCDPDRVYPDPAAILEQFGKEVLLDDMRTFWKGNRGDESLWEHEFAKHGTCMSTIDPLCYGPGYRQGIEAVDYFQQAVDVFKQLDSYSVRPLSCSVIGWLNGINRASSG
jgi:ribonuclease T2